MTFANQCPGSRSIREPIPEYFSCPKCSTKVEIWTDEMSRRCSKCGTRVFREQRGPSCIDWCPAAKECIGPEAYQRLKSEVDTTPVNIKSTTPLDIIVRGYAEILEQISILRGATLCLRSGTRATAPESSKIIEKGMNDLKQVLEFFDYDLRLHFRREEEVLLPLLENHLDKEESPLQSLIAEHAQLWQWYDQLKANLDQFQKDGSEHHEADATEIYEIANRIVGLLREHIERANTSLLTQAQSQLGEEALTKLADTWQKLRLSTKSA